MATLRVEFYPAAGSTQADPIAAQTVTVTGTALSGAGLITAPANAGNLLAVFTAIDAAIYVDLADTGANAATEPRRLARPGVRLETLCGAGWKISAATAADIPASTASASASIGVTPAQTFVPVPVFASGNTAGSGGTNATVVQVVAANASRLYLEVINNGSANVELWFGARPSDAAVGQTIPQGVVLAPGGGRSFEARVALGAIYASTSAAGGLSVLEG